MKKNFARICAAVCTAAMTIGLFAGCANQSNPTPTTAPSQTTADNKDNQETEKKELSKITIALDWTPNTNHTGIFVARELGYFEEAGIEVEIIEAIESGAEAVVAAGTAQFGISFQDYLVPLYSTKEGEQVPVTAVAAIIAHNTSGIVSPKELGIDSPGKLTGHNYATWDLPIEQAIMKQVVNADGGDWDQVELISQYVENIQGAFQSGIDSVWIYYAWDGINTELAGVDTNFFLFRDYGEELDDYSPVIIANDAYLAENSEEAKAFMNAVSKGYEYAMKNPEDAAKILVDANEGMDLALCTASQKWLADQYQAESPRWGEIDQKRWDAFYTWVYENGLCEYEIPAGYGFTNEYLPN